MSVPWALRRRGWLGPMSSTPSSLQHALQAIIHPCFLSVTIRHKQELYQVLQALLQPREQARV